MSGKFNVVRLWNNDKGMMTVEASLIIPLLWFVIAMIVFFSVFLLEMTAAESECMRISSEMTVTKPREGEAEVESIVSTGKTRLSGRISERVHMSKVQEREVLVHEDLAKAHVSIGFFLPVRGIRKYLGTEGWGLTCESVAYICHWEDYLRKGGS